MFCDPITQIIFRGFSETHVTVLHLNVNEYILTCLWKIVYSYVNQRWAKN